MARSRWTGKSNSAGVSSMKRVEYSLDRNSGCLSRFTTNGMLVLTPRMRNSRSARSIRLIAASGVRAQAVTLVSRLS